MQQSATFDHILNKMEHLVYQLKYDSIHDRYDDTTDGDSFIIDGQKVALSHTRDPSESPFTEHGVEYVCESTGVSLTTEKLEPHLKAGSRKVVCSAPAKDYSHTVMGLNVEVPQNEHVSYHTEVSGHSEQAEEKYVAKSVVQFAEFLHRRRGGCFPAVMSGALWTAARRECFETFAKQLGSNDNAEKEASYEEICPEVKSRSEGDMKDFLGYCDEPLVPTNFETHTISSTLDSNAGILDPTYSEQDEEKDADQSRMQLVELLLKTREVSAGTTYEEAWRLLSGSQVWSAVEESMRRECFEIFVDNIGGYDKG